MKLSLLLVLTAVSTTLAQSTPPVFKAPRQTGGMIVPVQGTPGPQTIQPPPPSRPSQCRVVSRELPGRGPVRSADSGQLEWFVLWDPSVSTSQRAVIQYALDEWRNTMLNTSDRVPNPYPIFIRVENSAASWLAQTMVDSYAESGNLAGSTMTINSRYAWFEDSTPADDSEFTNGSPPAQFDLLSVMRHELGHALGCTRTARMEAVISGTNVDPARLNIGYTWSQGGGFHTDPAIHPNDVMNPSIGTGVRQGISMYPAAALIARAFDYTIPMKFVDPNAGTLPLGTANNPYSSVVMTTNSSLVLLAPTTHYVPQNWSIGGEHKWIAARGGALVRVP